MAGPTSPNGSSTAEGRVCAATKRSYEVAAGKHSAACSEAHERKIVGRALKRSGEMRHGVMVVAPKDRISLIGRVRPTNQREVVSWRFGNDFGL